eukprot:33476-Pleurochrysis_carterae.AAC.1
MACQMKPSSAEQMPAVSLGWGESLHACLQTTQQLCGRNGAQAVHPAINAIVLCRAGHRRLLGAPLAPAQRRKGGGRFERRLGGHFGGTLGGHIGGHFGDARGRVGLEHRQHEGDRRPRADRGEFARARGGGKGQRPVAFFLQFVSFRLLD